MKNLYSYVAMLAMVFVWTDMAQAVSTVNPTVPAQNSPLSSAPIRNNFLAAYNDINALQASAAGPSPPFNPARGQVWLNTSVSPYTYNIYDGAVWVTTAYIDASLHLAGTPPPSTNLNGGVKTTTFVSHQFLNSVNSDGTVGQAQPACEDISNAGTGCPKNVGKSVNDPGTGSLENMLPIQTTSGASKTFLTADLQLETRRSNSGSAMTDTFPASSVTGMANGTRITLNNVDTTATDTVTAGAGTSFSSGSTDVVEAGRSVTYVYDLGTTTWRKTFNTGTAAIFPSTGSNVIGNLVGLKSVYGAVQDSGVSAANVVQGPASATSGNLASYNGTTGKLIQDSGVVAANTVTSSGSLTTNGVVVANGAKTITSTTAPTAGQLLIGQASAAPSPQTVTGDVTIAASGATTLVTSINHSYTASQRATPSSLSLAGSTATPNFDAAQNFSLTLSSACPCTLANPSTTPVAGQSGVIELIQDITGSRVISTWGSDYTAPGGTSTIILSTPASARDYLTYYVADATHIVLSLGAANATH